VVSTAWWWALLGGEHCLVVSTAWWWALLGGEHCLVVSTAWWWALLGGGDGLVVSTAWWLALLDDGDDLVVSTAWWLALLDGEDDLVMGDGDGLMGTAWWGRLDGDGLMRTAWWGRLDEDGLMGTAWWWRYVAVKSFYLILSNLRFRTISRVGFGRRTIAKTRPDPSDKNFCPTLGLDRVGLSDMSETQPCGQPNQHTPELFFLRWGISELAYLDQTATYSDQSKQRCFPRSHLEKNFPSRKKNFFFNFFNLMKRRRLTACSHLASSV
jgi:hypothetical protein